MVDCAHVDFGRTALVGEGKLHELRVLEVRGDEVDHSGITRTSRFVVPPPLSSILGKDACLNAELANGGWSRNTHYRSSADADGFYEVTVR